MRRVSPSLEKEAKDEAGRSRTLNIILAGFFPILFAFGGLVTPTLYADYPWGTVFACVLLASLYVALIAFTYRNPKTFVGLVVENQQLQADLDERTQELERVKKGARSLNAQAVSAMSLRGASLPYIRQPPRTPKKFRNMCANLLAPLEKRSGETLEVEGTESWTFVVYLDTPSGRCLRPIWWARSADHPSQGTPREWGYGQGHVGKAFANAEALVTRDALAQEVSHLTAPPGHLQMS